MKGDKRAKDQPGQQGVLAAVEDVYLEGHIIDSLILPRALDEILALGGDYEILDIRVGHGKEDPSRASLRVQARDEDHLELLLARLQRYGAEATEPGDARLEPAPADGVFPESFYSTTNLETYVRVSGRWIFVEHPEMDCGILVDLEAMRARTIPLVRIRHGEFVVVGSRGIRLVPMTRPRRAQGFEFMTSEVSAEKPKGLTVSRVAAVMRETHERRRKILAVVGPAVIHTGAQGALAGLIRSGWIDVIFAGNAAAAHDVEVALFGTSLGVDLARGVVLHGGHEHHIRAINRVRAVGGIREAAAKGVLTSGIFYEAVRRGIPYVLAGSIRDDGPLPDVITDVMAAQDAMRELIPGVGCCLMLSTMLHSVATGNLLPASVYTICIDINPAVVTKLTDRGSLQAVGVVTDVGLFLGELAADLTGSQGS